MSRPTSSKKLADPIQLDSFLPFRLSILSNTLSGAIARVYAGRYDLSMPEWRVLCVLAEGAPLAAREVADRTRMDKVMVSRAVNRLLAAGRIEKTIDERDRRRNPLTLSQSGAALYRVVAPVARQVETDLLRSLDPAERAALDRLIERMIAAADEIDAAYMAETPPSSTSSAPVMKPLSSDAR